MSVQQHRTREEILTTGAEYAVKISNSPSQCCAEITSSRRYGTLAGRFHK